MTTYMGWPNWETHNVALWTDNVEEHYLLKTKLIQARGCNAIAIKTFCLIVFPNGTPDMESPDDMNRVDHEALSIVWADEYESDDSDSWNYESNPAI